MGNNYIMIKGTPKISEVKNTIEKLMHKDLEVTLNLGRNKFISFSARLDAVYPALFTVKATEDGFTGKTTYSYSEYMCGKVKLKETT